MFIDKRTDEFSWDFMRSMKPKDLTVCISINKNSTALTFSLPSKGYVKNFISYKSKYQ